MEWNCFQSRTKFLANIRIRPRFLRAQIISNKEFQLPIIHDYIFIFNSPLLWYFMFYLSLFIENPLVSNSANLRNCRITFEDQYIFKKFQKIWNQEVLGFFLNPNFKQLDDIYIFFWTFEAKFHRLSFVRFVNFDLYIIELITSYKMHKINWG